MIGQLKVPACMIKMNNMSIVRFTIACLILQMLPADLYAQNLAPNPGFEEVACEPDDIESPVRYDADRWYSPTLGTPDLFADGPDPDGCVALDINSDEFMLLGEWQYPAAGLHMAGMYAYADLGCIREYLQAELTESMIAGHEYCVSFLVNLSNRSLLAVDRLGALFTMDSLLDLSGVCLEEDLVQISNPAGSYLTDTLGWMSVSGSFTATGGERFITIGHFVPEGEVAGLPVAGTGMFSGSYYYLDEVEVVDCTQIPDQIGVTDPNEPTFYPNPVRTEIMVRVAEPAVLTIADMHGRELIRQMILPGSNAISAEPLARGTYLLNISSVHYAITELLFRQ